MKSTMQLGIVFIVFLLASPRASAQTDHQKALWRQAEEEVSQLASQLTLSEKQKRFATRSFYNYHERLEALDKNVPHLPFHSKADVEKRLYKRMKDVLTAAQFAAFKAQKEKLLGQVSSTEL